MSAYLLIYTPRLSPRVKYIFSLFFESLITTPYKLTTDITEFNAYSGPRLNYSEGTITDKEIFIHSTNLLFASGIHLQNITVSDWDGLKIFYQTKDSSLPFDVFAASFYMVSRYEEYLPYETDKHNRFHHAASLAFKNHFLNVPIVNLWAEKLKSVLFKAYPEVTFRENTYSFIPTIDIDIAYAHLGRDIALATGSFLKALSKFQFNVVAEKIAVLLHLKKDPYDTFDYQESLFEKYKLHPIYFFLAGKRGHNDKNISPDSIAFKRLAKKLNVFSEIGIHPSYQSESNPEIVASEIKKVERSISTKITSSRQHFLRLRLPETYRCLAELGITDDYTMVFAGVPGFRAGICTPFSFYDLQADNVLQVKVHSSAVMDGTLNDYLRLSVEDSIKITKDLISIVKKCKGEFIVIWHNDNLSETRQWKGWRTYFENILKEASE